MFPVNANLSVYQHTQDNSNDNEMALQVLPTERPLSHSNCASTKHRL